MVATSIRKLIRTELGQPGSLIGDDQIYVIDKAQALKGKEMEPIRMTFFQIAEVLALQKLEWCKSKPDLSQVYVLKY